MRKLGNKGFLLAEALIVSTIVLTAITLLFIEYSRMYVNYKQRLRWNDVDAVIMANSFQSFVSREMRAHVLFEAMGSNNVYRVDCSIWVGAPNTFCRSLFNNGVQDIYVVRGFGTIRNPNPATRWNNPDFREYREFINTSLEANSEMFVIVVLSGDRYATVEMAGL